MYFDTTINFTFKCHNLPTPVINPLLRVLRSAKSTLNAVFFTRNGQKSIFYLDTGPSEAVF